MAWLVEVVIHPSVKVPCALYNVQTVHLFLHGVVAPTFPTYWAGFL